MNVTLVGPVYPYRGGIAHHTYHLAMALQDAGHTVQVVSFRRQYPGWLYPGATDRDPTPKSLPFDVHYLLDPLYPWTWLRAARCIEEFRPDMVLCQWWTTFWAPACLLLGRLLRRHRFPMVYVIHNVLPHEQRPWDVLLTRLTLQQSDHFLVQSARERARLEHLLPAASVTLAALPLYDIFPLPSLSGEEARQALGLPPDRALALCFGLVRPYKGVRFALEAIRYLHQRGETVHLVVAGEFWEPVQSYQRWLLEHHLTDVVHLDNRYIPDEEAGLYLKAADVFLAPYVGGSQSAAMKAALGAGLPIVAGRAIYSPELELPGIYWVDPTDTRGFAQAILDALHNGIAPPVPAVASWEDFVAALEHVYNSLQ